MNRIGFFTGNVYRDGALPEVGECCVMVSDEQLKDELYIMELKAQKKLNCDGCHGCPASNLNYRGG